MDDFDTDINRDIDDHVDEAELLPFRYQSSIEVLLPLGQSALSAKIWREGSNMNTDQALVLMGLVGAFLGFLIGYSKGHEHGKIAGRIAYRKSQRELQQVGR